MSIDEKAMQKALHAYAAVSEDGSVNLGGMQDALEAYEAAKETHQPDGRTQGLIERIEESLDYFRGEFPKIHHRNETLWTQPFSYHCGGVTPDDLEAISRLLRSPKREQVDLQDDLKAACVSMLFGSRPSSETGKTTVDNWRVKVIADVLNKINRIEGSSE